MCGMEERFLHEYIDGSLEPLERIILEEHLGTCADCCRELNRLKIIDWDLQRLYSEEIIIPPELSGIRETVLEDCFAQVTDQHAGTGAISPRDIWNLQVATFNNSFRFISLLSAKSRKVKRESSKPGKKSALLRKIIGL